MKRNFLLLLLLTLLPFAGWAQNVSWKSGASTEEVPFGLSGADLRSLKDRLNVTSSYGNEPCMFGWTNVTYPGGSSQYNLALFDSWANADNGTTTGLVTTTCETGKKYYLRVSVRHRINKSTYGPGYVINEIIIVRADNKITSPFTIENWNYGEPRKYPTIPTTTDGSTPNIQYSGDGANWGEYKDIVNDFPGDWYVRAYVPMSTNYNVLSEIRQFRINPIPVNLTLREVTKTWEKPWNNPTIDDLTSASYTVSGASWNDIKPYLKWDQVEPVVNAGPYKYTLKITGKSIYGINIDDSKAILKVEKADATLSTVGNGPSLTYSGKPQTLNADATPEFKDKGGNVAGDILYTLTPSNDSSWSTEVPKQTDAGSYTVFYKGDGDVNHNSAAQKSYTVLINKRTLTTDDFNPQTAKDPSPVYTGGELELVNPVTFKGEFAAELATACTVKYQVDGGAEADVAKAVNAKPNYEVKAIFKFGADANFENGTLYTINNAAIVKAEAGDITVTAAENLKFKYDPVGNKAVNQPLITAGTCPGATVLYSRTGAAGSYSATIPTGNHTDNYTVYYYAKGDANHNDKGSEASPVGSVEVKIAKTDYVLAQAPTAAKGVVYNAKEQPLLAQGCKRDETLCPVGKVTYYLDDNHSNPISGSDFKNVKATDARTYKVSWFVSAAPPFANDYKPISGSLEDAEIARAVLNLGLDPLTIDFGTEVTIQRIFTDVIHSGTWVAGEDYATKLAILNDNLDIKTSKDGGAAVAGFAPILAIEAGAGVYTIALAKKSNPTPGNYNVKLYSYSTTVTIKKIDATLAVLTPQTPVYDGNAKALVTVGTPAVGGDVMYFVGDAAPEAESTDWQAGIPEETNAGTYKVWQKVAGDENHKDVVATAAVEVTIDKAPASAQVFTWTKTDGFVYGATPVIPEATALENAEIEYSYALKSSGTFGPAPATWTVGTWVVHAVSAATTNYYGSSSDQEFTVTQASNKITGFAIEGWTYGDVPNAPTASAYFKAANEPAFTYSDSETGTFTADVPETAGTWYVKASVAATTDYAAAEQVISFKIEKAEVTDIVPPVKINRIYNAEVQTLVTPAKFKDGIVKGTFEYSLDEATWTTDVPTAKDAGNYTVYTRFVPDNNHEGTTVANVDAAIAKLTVTYTLTTIDNWEYNGKEVKDVPSALYSLTNPLELPGDDKFNAPFKFVFPETVKDAKDYNFYKLTVVWANAEKQNYEFKFRNYGKFTITPKPLTITIADQSVYVGAQDKDLNMGTATIKGIVGSDDIKAKMELNCNTNDVGEYLQGVKLTIGNTNYRIVEKEAVKDAAYGKLTVKMPYENGVLDDSKAFVLPEKNTIADVTFTSRAVNEDTWNVCVLPFETTPADISEAFGYAAVDVLNQDADDGNIHFQIVTSGVIPAGTPFIFKPSKDAAGAVADFNEVTFEDVVVVKSLANAAAGVYVDLGNTYQMDKAGNKFWGTFKSTSFFGKQYWYMSKGAWKDASKFTDAKPVSLKAFRAYVEFVTPAAGRIYIEELDGTETAIDAIKFNQMVNGDTYTIDGKKVSNTAQKGVYIRQGRVIVQ